MQNNTSKINTILLIILILIAGFIVWKLVSKEEVNNDSVVIPSVETQTNQNPNGPDYQSNQNTPSSNTQLKSAFGITVEVPNNLSFSTADGSGASSLVKSINISSGNKIVITINKFPSKAMFEEGDPGKDYGVSYVENYTIGNTVGTFYEGDLMEDLILIPSKFTVVVINPLTYAGISQSTIDQILSSIKFE